MIAVAILVAAVFTVAGVACLARERQIDAIAPRPPSRVELGRPGRQRRAVRRCHRATTKGWFHE